MNEKQVELIYRALRIIGKRAVDPNRDIATRIIYQSARDMIGYALDENEECLAQYDDVDLNCDKCIHFISESMDDVAFCNCCEDYCFFELMKE